MENKDHGDQDYDFADRLFSSSASIRRALGLQTGDVRSAAATQNTGESNALAASVVPLPGRFRRWVTHWIGALRGSRTNSNGQGKQLTAHVADGDSIKSTISTTARYVMKTASPQVTPRNWMLAEAYEAAERGDFSKMAELQTLFLDPYVDIPQDSYWIRATPTWARRGKAGISHMT